MEKLHTFKYTLNSPIRYLKIVSDSKHLLSLTFIEKPEPNSKNIPEILENSKIQLEEYFLGNRKLLNFYFLHVAAISKKMYDKKYVKFHLVKPALI